MSKTPEYRIWKTIINRCENPKSDNYAWYGGADIKLCPEWRANFKAFYDYLGPRPSPSYQVDRIDNSRGYEPGNVRWATRSEQAYNRKTTVWVKWQGRVLKLGEAAGLAGITWSAAYQRMRVNKDFIRVDPPSVTASE